MWVTWCDKGSQCFWTWAFSQNWTRRRPKCDEVEKRHLFWQQLPLGGSPGWIFPLVASRVVEVRSVHTSHLLLPRNQNPPLTRRCLSTQLPCTQPHFLKEQLSLFEFQLRDFLQQFGSYGGGSSRSELPRTSPKNSVLPIVFGFLLQSSFNFQYIKRVISKAKDALKGKGEKVKIVHTKFPGTGTQIFWKILRLVPIFFLVPNFFETSSETFFGTNFFSRPVPRLFSVPNFLIPVPIPKI